MYWPNLKSVALPVPEIIWGTHNLGSPWISPRSLFFKKFLMGFCSDGPLLFWPNLKFVTLPVPEIIAIGVLVRGYKPPISRRP